MEAMMDSINEPRPVIPTTYRDRLPRFASYPAGAEALSEAFRGVLSPSDTSRSFLRGDITKFQNPETSATPYTVLRVGYWRDHHPMMCPWTISVFAVPGSLRHRIADELKTSGYEQIREWLARNRDPAPFVRRLWLHVVFDPASETLLLSEDR